MSFSNLLQDDHLNQLVDSWFLEDIPGFDYGGFVVGDLQSSAVILSKSRG